LLAAAFHAGYMRGPLNTMLTSLPVVLAQVSPFDPRGMLVPIIGTLVIMYLLVIRPQQKQAKETQSLLASLKKGDDVVTTGGMLGKIHSVDEKVVTLDLGGGTRVRVLKTAIQSKVTVEAPKTEAKSDAKSDSKADAAEAKKEEK
jgi:preprotein translocase subunit YajC